MAKFCYRTGSETKKYELKDSADKPRLAVRTDANTTKYLRLKPGVKSGELCVRIGSQNFQVITWDYTDINNWKGLFPGPFKGMVGPKGDTTVGGFGILALVNEDGYPVVLIGRSGADRPDDRFRAFWRPNIAGTDDETKYPGNLTLTTEQLQHPGRLRPNFRMSTLPSNFRPTSEYGNFSASGRLIASTNYSGDYYSSKNNVIIADIVESLLNTSNYSGCMWNRNEFASDGGVSGYLRVFTYSYGSQSINKTGIYLQDPTKYPNGSSAGGEWYRSIRGIQSDGLTYNGVWVTYRNENAGSNNDWAIPWYGTYYYMLQSGLTSINSYSMPYIQMYGHDDMNDNSAWYGNWAQRDFYIEFPYAWGEDTDPNAYFTFTPKQVLQALLQIATASEIQNFDFGFTRGRNYGEEFQFQFYSLTPAKGMRGVEGNTEHGGAGVWVMVNQTGYPVVAFGRMGADVPDNSVTGYWRPNITGTEDEEKYPGNFILDSDHMSHPGRLKPNIRLATIVSVAGATTSGSAQMISMNTNAEDAYSNRNNVIIRDVVNSLLTNAGNYHGFNKAKDGTVLEHFGYGYTTLNQTGVYYPSGSEEHPDNDGYSDFDYGYGNTGHPNKGISSDGFKTTAPVVYKHASTPRGYLWDADHLALHTGTDSDGVPYVIMYGLADDKLKSWAASIGRFAQRDFYIEFPYAWGENTNPNDYFTFTPKQVLQEFLRQAEAGNVKEYDFGFTRGRNYGKAQLLHTHDVGVTSGTVFADLYDDETLRIRGTGPMADYPDSGSSPLLHHVYSYSPYLNYSVHDKVSRVYIEDGVTRVGNMFFCSCSFRTDASGYTGMIGDVAYPNDPDTTKHYCIKYIHVPSSVKSLGKSLFTYSYGPSEEIAITWSDGSTEHKRSFAGPCQMDIEEGLETIDPYAFGSQYVYIFQELTFPSTLKTVGHDAFGACLFLRKIEFKTTGNLTLGQYCMGGMGTGITDFVQQYIDSGSLPLVPDRLEVIFHGNAPTYGASDYPFANGNYLIKYPANNSTWTEAVKNDIANMSLSTVFEPF